MSICASNMSANTPVKKPSKEGEHFQSHPDFTKNFKLINDPILTRCPPPTYRYDGVMPGLKSPIEVVDPRSRFPRTNTRSKNIFLPIPEFIVDKHYVLPIKPKEISFTNLNNNVNVKFLEDMCKCFGIIQETFIYYHPTTKKHLGLGKVIFATSSSARKCAEKLNNTSSMGNILNVFLDDKGAERDKLFKELTKDPSKAEFMPPMPNAHLKKDVLIGMFPATSTPTSLPQSMVTTNTFASPGADKIQTPANHNQAFIASQVYSRSHSLINSDYSTNGDAIVLQRKSSTSNAGSVHRSSSGEGLFGSSISGNSNPDLANKSSQRDSNTTATSCSTLHSQQVLTSPVSSSVPFHNRQAPNFNQSLCNNSRESRPQQKPSDLAFWDNPYKDKTEVHGRIDKSFDHGAKERPFRREDRHADKKWTWHQGKDYKDRQNKNGDKSNWKDKYSSPNNRKNRNRDRKDLYDNSYNRSGWSKQVRDSTQESSIRVPDNSQSFENLLEGSHIGTPGPLSNDRGKSKSIDTPDKNGQTPFSDLDDKKTETAIKINLLDKRMNLLANSDDNAVDSSHLFVQCPKKGEPTEQEDDKHESLESRIQALLGQNLPFALPSSTAQIPVVPQSVPQKSPPQPPLPPSPSPPLPPPPSQCDLDINIPPPSIYSFPPPPLTVPLPMTPVVPPNISYPTLPQNLSIFPIPVGSVPSLVTQHVEPSRPAMMVQWRFHSEAVSTPPPSMTLPPLNIPPPPLPTQGVPATLHQEEQDPEIKQMEEEKAKFRKVFNELIYQLKEVLSKDLKKKMVEASAFKEFEDWWNEKSKEHNEKILNSKQQMKMTGSSSGADLRNGEQKVVAAVSEKSSAIPPPDRSQIMDTLSGLFDKSGSFAGGLLGLRKMRLTSMPSFRKKPEPPKIGNERIKNIHEDDEDEDDMIRRPVFRGPRTPEGSENEENLSDSSSGSDSDSETLHVGRPDPGKSYKPPSPPPSPIHTRKEPDKKSKVKVERKVEKPKPKSQKMEIYSSSSSDSDLSRKEEEDYNDELSDGSSDIDVMNLVKKVKEPARKFAVYTSDEEDEDYADGSKRTSTPQKGKAPSICSSPSVSDSDSGPEKQIDVCAVDRDSSKKSAIIKTSTPKLKPPVGRSSSKVQKEEGSKRKYTSRKPKNALPQKKQRVRSRSTRGDDDDVNYVSHIKKVDVRSSNYMSLKENDHATSRQQITGERKRCTSLASADIRMHETKNYDEIQPLDGYLHLLSDVASEVKQAEVNKTYSTAFFASDQTEQQSKFGSAAEYSGAHPNEEMRDARKIRTYSQGDVTSQAPLQEMEKRLPLELDDHYYSLKPWMEVKSKKGRKPKPKPSAPTLNSKESDSFSSDETVALFPSDDEESTKFSNVNCNGLALLLREHSYASANIFSPDMLYRSRSSDSEGDDVATDWPQVYVEDLDVSMNSNMGGKKFTLEMIPHIGGEVDIAVEKPEQEKNINVVDDEDEEEEGECHSSSDEDKMVIDEGLSKPAPGRKRKRSTVDADVEVSEKKMKVEKKFQHSAKHSSASGKLPRELVNLIQSSFSTPEPKPVKFMKRDFKEEAFILYDFVTKGIDEEDANFIKLQFEKIHQREQEKILDHVESHCKWAFESKWIGHPVKTDFDSPSSKKSRKSSKHKGFEPHKSGSARTEGYYKIPHQAKQYLKHAHGVQEQQSIQVNSDEFPASSISSTSLLTTETTLDAMVRKRAQQNREARSEGRRWQNLLTSNLGEDVAELLKFNQLQIRKKQLRFAKSRIHDWGLFAMEPIAEGELVIEYVGQIIRQSVADLREKRYEADGIGSSYLFRIDQSTIVDATRFGNLSRFINHCCNPNCYAKIVSVDGVKRIVIYSRRDIEVNEEITYDYKFPIEDDKIPCLCGASGCRGTLN